MKTYKVYTKWKGYCNSTYKWTDWNFTNEQNYHGEKYKW